MLDALDWAEDLAVRTAAGPPGSEIIALATGLRAVSSR
jgi:hypothetical protein